ncbi:DUF3597 family protein [Acidisphaera sp. L21]|uniref:DUF3597 family protein n=1 Tax=Acidisphaera sp. L21 TaxID=1641851 RepID=UPI00131CA593|nr:DUF3597 family protein [Acidisphaera sp. L21]
MSIFGAITNKIFQGGPVETQTTIMQSIAQTAPETVPQAEAASPTTSSSSSQPVDVEVVLGEMTARKDGGRNYQTSIVDLLKLLDLDSSLQARTELTTELDIHAGSDGSADENVALHKAVMRKLTNNGGKVPESMRG